MLVSDPVSVRPRAGASRQSVALAAAGLSFASACIHGSVIATHFREYFLFGLFFAIVTPLQVAWSELVRRRPEHRRLLIWGAGLNFGIAAVWVVSRTVGLPFGPLAFQPEAIGWKDLLASYAEFFIVLLVAAVVLRDGRHVVPRWAVGLAWATAAAALLAALIGGGH